MKLNLRWSLADIMKIEEMARRRCDARTIAEAFLTTPEEIEELCVRNGIVLPGRRNTPPKQGA